MQIVHTPRRRQVRMFAAAPSGSVSLLNGPDGQFSNSRFEELKKILYDALADADQQLERVRQVAEDAAGSWAITRLSPAKTAGQAVLKYLPGAKKRLADLRAKIDGAARNINSPIWNAAPTYRKMTAFQAVLDDIGAELKGLNIDLELLETSTDQTFLTALGERALEMTRQAYEYAGQAGAAALELIEDTAKTGKEGIESSLWLARNWWKILLAGVVVFYGVPFVLRARREGARGVEEGLREGRQVIGEGAKKAGSAAAKAGAAYASGGASLAVSGLKRRRSRRNKRG